MKLKVRLVALLAVLAIPAMAGAQSVPVGRWEIVHTSGDSTAQTNMYPGGFSTYLYSNGTGDTYGTSANSICVIDGTGSNVVPSWTETGGEIFTITITVDNMGLGPNVSFVYTGTYNPLTPVPGDLTLTIPTISGTFTTTGNATACSTATTTSPGTFVATFLPDLNSGSSTGSLDGNDTQSGSPFDASVNATITYSAPSTLGEMAGSVALSANPTFGHQACFAGGSTPDALTINSSLSTQAGILESIYAEGLDPQGNPTTLVLQGYSANLYTTASNTDVNANSMGGNEWAAAAAIGEDDPSAGTAGVSDDGTNNAIVEYYNVVGGVCDGAGGSDAPFRYIPAKPVKERHPRPHRKPRKDKDPEPRIAAVLAVVTNKR